MSYFSVISVKPEKDYKLTLEFDNGEKRVFDMKPHLNIGLFQQLKDLSMFNTVRVNFDTIEWANNADIDPEYLYEQSKLV